MRGRIDVSEPNGADIVDFLERTSQLDYARHLTLFLKPPFRLAVSGPGVRSADGDGVGFLPLTAKEEELHDLALGHIAASSHELQVHLHHEYYTGNEMYATQARYNKTEALREYLAEKTTPAQDEARFKLLIDMTLEYYRRGSGLELRRWFFVHGMWALNGSDRDVCTIDREIGLLQEKGCLGDFTFPAGRPHTDPAHLSPFFCKSVDKAKCYDLPESEPAFAYGARPDGRFFIWASPIKHKYSSIDYYSKEIRASLEDIERLAQELVQTSVFLDGNLFLKTHAHSMNTDYFDNIRRPIYPHFHPGVQALLGVILDAASDAGLTIHFPTAGEVFDRFTAASWGGSTDIASDDNTIRRRQTSQAVVNAMTPLQRLDAFAPLAISASHAVVGARLAELGATEAGAYEYYMDLYERDTLIHPYELAVARYLAQSLPDGAAIHEFGTGFGSMALLLAVAGFDVLAIDVDPRRLATARAIRAELGKQVPWLAGRLNFKEAAIPDVLGELDCAGVTAVATDVTSGTSLADLEAIVEAAGSRYASVVFDVERFFTRTRDQDETARVRELFARWYASCRPVTDAGVGRFFFHATAPRAAPPLAAAPSPQAPSPRAPAIAEPSAAIPAAPKGEPLGLEAAVALIDRVGVETLKERIALGGVEGSGAGAFYAQIVGRGHLAQGYDVAVARWLLENLDPTTPILEIGAGVGALSLLLAAAGRAVVAVDLDARRVDIGREIATRAAAALGQELGDLRFVEAKFPLEPSPVPRNTAVVVITNMVFGWNDEEQRAMLAEIARFEGAIVDADRFGVQRSTPEARDAFDVAVRLAGLSMTPLDLVPDMRFVRLSRLGAPARRRSGEKKPRE
jgi:predicted RNA methylase